MEKIKNIIKDARIELNKIEEKMQDDIDNQKVGCIFTKKDLEILKSYIYNLNRHRNMPLESDIEGSRICEYIDGLLKEFKY